MDPRADLREVATRVRVSEVCDAVTCVTPELTIGELREVLAGEGLRTVVVVDEEGRLQGIVSRTDLTMAADFGRVGDMMTSRVHALPEDAPVGWAIALMGLENISEVPVVRADGTVLGVCQATSLLGWIASRLGYVLGPTEAS